MKEQMEYILGKCGYAKLVTNREEFNIYFQLENSCVNAVFVLDYEHYPAFSKEEFDKTTQKTVWRFADGGYAEVHVLSLVLTENIELARALSAGETFSWIIDTSTKELLIDEDKTPDFYGMKQKIEEGLNLPYDPGQVREDLLERDVKGNQVYHNFWQGPLVNHFLFLSNIIIFVLCFLTGDIIYDWGIMSAGSVVTDGQWYRMFTAMFLHADISHLLSNMLILYILGDIVERGLGHGKYLALYLLAGLGGGFLSLYSEYLLGNFAGSLGASGAIFGMIGALLWMLIRNQGRLEDITTPRILFLIAYSLYSGFRSTNVDNAAHIGGLLAGLLLCILLYRKKRAGKR